MYDLNDFNAIHFDVLKEIGNIGAGNAVTSLSKLLNKKIDMTVPVVNLVDFKYIADFLGGAENIIIGILLNVMGDINGIMMFIVKRDSARILIDTLMGTSEIHSASSFSELELSGLMEIGNILASSYLGSLASLINKNIRPSVPSLTIDMANAILSVPAIEFGKVADKVLFIESVFQADEEKENISGYFILVPDLPSFHVILSSLGVV